MFSNEENSFVNMVKCESFSFVFNFVKVGNSVGVNLLRFSCSSLSLFDFLQHKSSFSQCLKLGIA